MAAPASQVEPRAGDVVKLGDVFQHPAIGDGGHKADMQLHQEMRTDGDVMRLGQMRDLEPWGDAADAGHVHLHDAGGVAGQVVLELAERIQAFAHRDRHGRAAGQLRMRADIVGGQGFLEPADAVIGQHLGAHQRLMQGKSLIGIGEDVEEMLRSDLALELDGAKDLREAIAYADSVHDYVSRDMMIQILIDEEGHIDWLETELDLIGKIGLQNYLQSQIKVEE